MNTYTCLSFVSSCLALSSLFLLPSVSTAAGGGDANAGIGNAANINGVGNPNSSGNPGSGISPSSGFSFSQQFQGYGNGISNCGTQAFVNSGVGNGGNTNGNTVGTNYTITGGFIFNQQECLNPNKQLQVQSEQTITQQRINCVQERGKLVAIIYTKNPSITPEELDRLVSVVCR